VSATLSADSAQAATYRALRAMWPH
jgi:hypothetical protein